MHVHCGRPPLRVRSPQGARAAPRTPVTSCGQRAHALPKGRRSEAWSQDPAWWYARALLHATSKCSLKRVAPHPVATPRCSSTEARGPSVGPSPFLQPAARPRAEPHQVTGCADVACADVRARMECAHGEELRHIERAGNITLAQLDQARLWASRPKAGRQRAHHQGLMVVRLKCVAASTRARCPSSCMSAPGCTSCSPR
mmetsp:Transcript_22758/g.76441  ORF Transcript_22758/g.76441 Transcript_22758/m.76441 type:complete len:200 (-) Transcript_22758:1342-1941(-)